MQWKGLIPFGWSLWQMRTPRWRVISIHRRYDLILVLGWRVDCIPKSTFLSMTIGTCAQRTAKHPHSFYAHVPYPYRLYPDPDPDPDYKYILIDSLQLPLDLAHLCLSHLTVWFSHWFAFLLTRFLLLLSPLENQLHYPYRYRYRFIRFEWNKWRTYRHFHFRHQSKIADSQLTRRDIHC